MSENKKKTKTLKCNVLLHFQWLEPKEKVKTTRIQSFLPFSLVGTQMFCNVTESELEVA